MVESFRPENLLSVYDVGFLAYILNENRDQVSRRLREGDDAFAPEKEGVLSDLVNMETELLQLPEGQQSFERNARLSRYIPDIDATPTTYFRRVCGGVEKLPSASDEVERLLLHFAAVTYPLQLQNDTEIGHRTSIRVSWQDPMREQLQTAVMADETLSKLYPHNTKHGGQSGIALRSTGRGGGVQLLMFAETIMTVAWHYAHFDSEKPSFDEYAGAVLNVVRTLKKALQGKKAEVPMRIGLAGVLFPEGVDSLDLGWARIRRADPRDAYFTRRVPVQGQLHHTNAEGGNVVIDYIGNLVLELEVPYRILLQEDGDLTAPWPPEINPSAAIAEPIECVRLAMLLAGVGENSVATPTWQSVADPLDTGGSISIGWSDPRQGTNLSPVQLTQGQAELWADWAARVHGHRTPQTNVSIRRILRAVSERKEPEDTLIDAVIVWENLFGAGQETTLRITMSVAWMLGTDGDNRKKLFDELKKVYQQRSDIVHGNAKLKTNQTQPYALLAIQISIRLLRIMFKDHPDLLKLKTGAERSALALLDAGYKTEH